VLKYKSTAYWKEYTADTSIQPAIRDLHRTQTDEHLQSKRHKWVGRAHRTTVNVIIMKEAGNFQKHLLRKCNKTG